MDILIVTPTTKYRSYERLYRKYLKKRGVKYHHATRRRESIEKAIAEGNLKPKHTLVYARSAGPKASRSYLFLEQQGFTIINPRHATSLTSHKYNAQIFAREHGLPVADTFKCQKSDVNRVLDLLKQYGRLVIKPIFSLGQGKYCRKVDLPMTQDELTEVLNSVPGSEVIVQQYVRYTRLIRTIVVDFKMLREATTFDEPLDGQWKASVCVNPRIRKYDVPDDRLPALAEATAKAFRAPISFIDFFEDDEGNYTLSELNTACSLIQHERITGVKIHRHIADFLIGTAEIIA